MQCELSNNKNYSVYIGKSPPKDTQTMGWTKPQNYREIALAYSQLGLSAYKKLVNYSIADLVIRYWKYVLLSFFFLTSLMGTVIYIASLNKNLKATQDKLHEMVNTDGLTGLPSRICFMALADKYMQIAKREKRKTAVMFLDLDKFKPINDTYGHDVGDARIRDVKELNSSQTRHLV